MARDPEAMSVRSSRGVEVRNYRVYFAREAGRLELGESFTCSSDEEAIARTRQARPPLGCHVELWEGGRLVARLPEAPR